MLDKDLLSILSLMKIRMKRCSVRSLLPPLSFSELYSLKSTNVFQTVSIGVFWGRVGTRAGPGLVLMSDTKYTIVNISAWQQSPAGGVKPAAL